MALCESQLDSALPQLKSEISSPRSEEGSESPEKKPKLEPNGDIYGLDQVPGGLPLSVDYRSPVSHFVPPAVEMYAARQNVKSDQASTAGSTDSPTPPVKRKRGRPRVDKTSPEYIAKSAARKQAKEMVRDKRADVTPHAALNNRENNRVNESGEKRKRGRPRVDKTSPEYLARKRARELEALERKAKREYKRRSTGDSAASSSAGDGTPRVKRKYTRRNPIVKKNDGSTVEKVKGKRGRPRKVDVLAANNAKPPQQAKIRVRSNLMPENSETITLDSDDEPDLGSPGASDSLSLDENLRALRHIHEKYANIDKDDLYEAHLLAANFKKPPLDQPRVNNRDDDEVLSIRSSEGPASIKELDTRVEKLEDSSNSDSDSSSSGSGSSSSGSSSSSSSGSSSSSDSSDSESESGDEKPKAEVAPPPPVNNVADDDRSYGAWSFTGAQSDDASDSDPERQGEPIPVPRGEQDEISESDNESPDKSFQCHICRKWYSTRVTLKIHRRVHQNRGGGGNSRSRARSSDKYECDCCNETFNRREKLWEHKAEAHRGSMTVRCEVCRKCFEDDAELAAHDRTHTADERAGRCSECGASFARYDQLRRHRSCAHPTAVAASGGGPTSGARLPHACHQCGKRFGHAHSLTRHMHNHAKQLYRCVVCKASFARADQLAQHLNSHLANYKRLKP